MDNQFSSILWREINRDIKSSKVFIGSFVICLSAALFYEKYRLIDDTFYYAAIGLLIFSFTNSSYFLNNIIAVLCLPIKMSNYCIARTIYKILKLCILIFSFMIIMKISYNINVFAWHVVCVKGAFVLLTFITSIYFFEYIILIMGKKYFSIAIIIQTYILSLLKVIAFNFDNKINMLLMLIELLIIMVVYLKSKTIDYEKIVRRWI